MGLPNHIAIVMDGNGRWAQERGRPRIFGHVRGASRVKPVILEANRLGVKALTLFAFSTENWFRPSAELEVLWKLLKKLLRREMEELHANDVLFKVIGEIARLPREIQELILRAERLTQNNTGLALTFAVSYGGRRDLEHASRLFAEDCLQGKRKPSDMSESLMAEYLWTRHLGAYADVDLVIRTSGEYRVSNFLIWQAAYAEYLFTDLFWPDFGPRQLNLAIEEFGRRKRRFGRVEVNSQGILNEVRL